MTLPLIYPNLKDSISKNWVGVVSSMLPAYPTNQRREIKKPIFDFESNHRWNTLKLQSAQALQSEITHSVIRQEIIDIIKEELVQALKAKEQKERSSRELVIERPVGRQLNSRNEQLRNSHINSYDAEISLTHELDPIHMKRWDWDQLLNESSIVNASHSYFNWPQIEKSSLNFVKAQSYQQVEVTPDVTSQKDSSVFMEILKSAMSRMFDNLKQEPTKRTQHKGQSPLTVQETSVNHHRQKLKTKKQKGSAIKSTRTFDIKEVNDVECRYCKKLIAQDKVNKHQNECFIESANKHQNDFQRHFSDLNDQISKIQEAITVRIEQLELKETQTQTTMVNDKVILDQLANDHFLNQFAKLHAVCNQAVEIKFDQAKLGGLELILKQDFFECKNSFRLYFKERHQQQILIAQRLKLLIQQKTRLISDYYIDQTTVKESLGTSKVEGNLMATPTVGIQKVHIFKFSPHNVEFSSDEEVSQIDSRQGALSIIDQNKASVVNNNSYYFNNDTSSAPRSEFLPMTARDNNKHPSQISHSSHYDDCQSPDSNKQISLFTKVKNQGSSSIQPKHCYEQEVTEENIVEEEDDEPLIKINNIDSDQIMTFNFMSPVHKLEKVKQQVEVKISLHDDEVQEVEQSQENDQQAAVLSSEKLTPRQNLNFQFFNSANEDLLHDGLQRKQHHEIVIEGQLIDSNHKSEANKSQEQSILKSPERKFREERVVEKSLQKRKEVIDSALKFHDNCQDEVCLVNNLNLLDDMHYKLFQINDEDNSQENLRYKRLVVQKRGSSVDVSKLRGEIGTIQHKLNQSGRKNIAESQAKVRDQKLQQLSKSLLRRKMALVITQLKQNVDSNKRAYAEMKKISERMRIKFCFNYLVKNKLCNQTIIAKIGKKRTALKIEASFRILKSNVIHSNQLKSKVDSKLRKADFKLMSVTYKQLQLAILMIKKQDIQRIKKISISHRNAHFNAWRTLFHKTQEENKALTTKLAQDTEKRQFTFAMKATCTQLCQAVIQQQVRLTLKQVIIQSEQESKLADDLIETAITELLISIGQETMTQQLIRQQQERMATALNTKQVEEQQEKKEELRRLQLKEQEENANEYISELFGKVIQVNHIRIQQDSENLFDILLKQEVRDLVEAVILSNTEIISPSKRRGLTETKNSLESNHELNVKRFQTEIEQEKAVSLYSFHVDLLKKELTPEFELISFGILNTKQDQNEEIISKFDFESEDQQVLEEVSSDLLDDFLREETFNKALDCLHEFLMNQKRNDLALQHVVNDVIKQQVAIMSEEMAIEQLLDLQASQQAINCFSEDFLNEVVEDYTRLIVESQFQKCTDMQFQGLANPFITNEDSYLLKSSILSPTSKAESVHSKYMPDNAKIIKEEDESHDSEEEKEWNQQVRYTYQKSNSSKRNLFTSSAVKTRTSVRQTLIEHLEPAKEKQKRTFLTQSKSIEQQNIMRKSLINDVYYLQSKYELHKAGMCTDNQLEDSNEQIDLSRHPIHSLRKHLDQAHTQIQQNSEKLSFSPTKQHLQSEDENIFK